VVSESAEQRFERLWHDHAPAVLRYARRHVLPDEVEDVVAETFVVAWRRFGEVPVYGLPWLLGVSRHVSANVRRARRRRDALSDRVAGQVQDDSTAGWPAPEPDDAVTTALCRLSDADRELLTLIAWDELTPDEAAEALGCSKGALKVRLHRARRRFAALLGAGSVGPPAATPTLHPLPSARPTGGPS
jgi:RNA polymerase sigma-70 factor (ECF subfamily)